MTWGRHASSAYAIKSVCTLLQQLSIDSKLNNRQYRGIGATVSSISLLDQLNNAIFTVPPGHIFEFTGTCLNLKYQLLSFDFERYTNKSVCTIFANSQGSWEPFSSSFPASPVLMNNPKIEAILLLKDHHVRKLSQSPINWKALPSYDDLNTFYHPHLKYVTYFVTTFALSLDCYVKELQRSTLCHVVRLRWRWITVCWPLSCC